MRRFSFPCALAICLASAVAFADSDRVTAQFEALQANGISGDARLNPMVQGSTRIQVQLKGLLPNTEYVAVIFQESECPDAGVSTPLATFTANPSGNAIVHELVSQDISAIGSISVRLASDPTNLACATVTQ